MDGVEFGQTAVRQTPAKIVDDVTLHTRGLGCIDHGLLRYDPTWADYTYCCILARECFGQVLEVIGSMCDGNSFWMSCLGVGS